jgi:DnaJ-class molecular chaperone
MWQTAADHEIIFALLPQFELDKNILCDHCRGTGAATDGDVVRCGGCNGQGIKVQRAQVFPGMYTNMQVTCPDCSGKGTVIRRSVVDVFQAKGDALSP